MEYQRILSVFLHHPLVSPTTHNVIHALLYHCWNPEILSRSLVSSITHQLDFLLGGKNGVESVLDYWFNLAHDHRGLTSIPLEKARSQEVENVLAMAYNDVSHQWMTDFLLYRASMFFRWLRGESLNVAAALGKRRRRTPFFEDYSPLESESEVIRSRTSHTVLQALVRTAYAAVLLLTHHPPR